MQLQNPLWAFALKVYSHSEVEQCCLALQNDFGMSVNRLLFAGWLAFQQKSIDLPALEQSQASVWQKEMTHPLRVLRYQLRPLHKKEPELGALYQAMRKAELEAEKIELAHLHALANNWHKVVIPLEVLMPGNIERLAAFPGSPISAAQQKLLTSLSQQMMLLG
ncbi:TIGR02444 family protein [Neptunomonas japonica]|uniref:TIGR02444 family protein n=1 Tax=Neptunomonas japonica TaxID=417574 RepID=UPI0004045081|nr:TIGR02444 family protein [Neptunomonas japonica]